jgi:hypothetical protein
MSNFIRTTKKRTKPPLFKDIKKVFAKTTNFSGHSNDILALQRRIGNQAVQRIMKSGIVQAGLNISQPNDKYEKEADAAADKVMKMSEPQVQRQNEEEEEEETVQTKPVGEQITPLVQRQPEEEEEEMLQAKADRGGFEVGEAFGSQLKDAASEGQTMHQRERAYFEPRFGVGFSGVRIHTGSKAQQLARSINAQAFTHGSDIYFGAGKYNPYSAEGRHLMAHELTHTIQQSGTNISRQENKKEEKEKPRDKAIKAAGKAAVKTFFKTKLGEKFKLKLMKFAKTPGGITLAGIGGASALSYMFAKNMDAPQGLIGLVPKFAKIDLSKNMTLSFQPIYKGKLGQKPKEWGGMINLTVTKW